MIISSRMRWDVACRGESKIHMNHWFEILKGTDHMEDQGEEGRVIFKMQLTEMGYEAIDRMKVAYNRLQWQALISQFPRKVENLGNNNITIIIFTRSPSLTLLS